MALSPKQCRAARERLFWDTRDLAEAAGQPVFAVEAFERGAGDFHGDVGRPTEIEWAGVEEDIEAALTSAGAVFPALQGGEAVRLWPRDATEVQRHLIAVDPTHEQMVGRSLPPSWTPWRRPTSEDDKTEVGRIDSLIDDRRADRQRSTRKLRLRNRRDLEGDGVLCPYWATRIAIFVAMLRADQNSGWNKSAELRATRALTAQINAVEAARKSIMRDIGQVGTIDIVSAMVETVDNAVSNLSAGSLGLAKHVLTTKANLLRLSAEIDRCLAGLHTISSDLRDDLRFYERRSRWDYAFVSSLAEFWERLTGAPVSIADDGEGQFFIHRCYGVLGFHERNDAKRRQMRKVIDTSRPRRTHRDQRASAAVWLEREQPSIQTIVRAVRTRSGTELDQQTMNTGDEFLSRMIRLKEPQREDIVAAEAFLSEPLAGRLLADVSAGEIEAISSLLPAAARSGLRRLWTVAADRVGEGTNFPRILPSDRAVEAAERYLAARLHGRRLADLGLDEVIELSRDLDDDLARLVPLWKFACRARDR